MENPFDIPRDSPFEELGKKWQVPDGELPHPETVRVLRTLGGAGEVTKKELLWLAYFLNENREARHSWPGEPLLQILMDMFDHRTPTKDDRDLVCADLAAIEQECARVAVDPGPGVELPAGAVRVEELRLPDVNRILDVVCEDVELAFQVDLRRQSCACPGWPNNRSKLHQGDVRRCCTHMVDAYQRLIVEGELTDVPPILKAVFEDRSKRGRSCDTSATWKLVKIQLRPYLVILRHHSWSYVYAPDGPGDFSRYAYDLQAGRWAYGQQPINHGTLVGWIRQELAGPGGM